MDDFWGEKDIHNPTYSQALRQFIRHTSNSHTVAEIRRLAAYQASLERGWYSSRHELEKNGADEVRLADFDRRIHHQASKFAENMNVKLGDELGLPLFRKTAESSPTVHSDRIKFMRFLSDLIAVP